MNRRARQWMVRLSAAAEADFAHIVQWTAERFGRAQALAYAQTLTLALEALYEGPNPAGVRVRDDIGKGLCSLHVGRRGRKGRHFVLFRCAPDSGQVVEVLRLLHDAMDPTRHIGPLELPQGQQA